MNAPIHRRSRRLRQLKHAVWMAPVAAIGLALGVQLPAAAGGVVPTIPAPPVPVPAVDVPQLLPTTTSTTTTDPGTPTETPSAGVAAAGTQAAGGPAPTASKSTSAVAGAVRLRSGAVSIPVSSVRPPARVRVSVSLQPTTMHRAGQAIQARVHVTDSRGFVVRGAEVGIRSVPADRLAGLGQKLSTLDGQVAFRLVRPARSASRSSLLLVVSAVDPTAPKLAAASGSIRLAVRVGR